MAEGMNKMFADLKNLNISDDVCTENSSVRIGERTENFNQLSTYSEELIEKDFDKNTADKRSDRHLRYSNDAAGFSNDNRFLEGFSSCSLKPDTENRNLFDRGGIRERIISEGEEIADLIVGCYRALDIFQSYYDEWASRRQQSQSLLEQLAETIATSSKKTEIIKNVIGGFERAEGGLQAIPNPLVSLGARLAAMFSTLILKVFGPNYSTKDVEQKELEIRQLFQKDIDTSSSVYIYGVQCALQFEETCKAIRDFRLRIRQQNLSAIIEDKMVLQFLNDISEFNPSNVTVFYKILRRAYERLIKNSKSNESRSLIKVFEVMPAAVGVINLLNWRFDSDGFDNSITQGAWDELFEIFNNSDTYSLQDFLAGIRNCLFFLEKERNILEKSVLNLLNEKI